jgi:hypothetical protein
VTPDERSILKTFLTDLSQTPNVAKDPEADAMIAEAMRSNPNAAYLLVQHAILADQALHAAQAQLAAQSSSGSFLTPAPQAPAQTGGYASPWAGQGGAPIQSSPFAAQSGLGGFLRNAGQMAVGVAAGDFLFQGIENIFGPRW